MSTIEDATIGVIYGNRDFFPDHLVTEARGHLSALFDKLNIRQITLGEADTKLGGVSTYQDAVRCAELFRKNADQLDGVLVCLPNFGDEKAVADTLKLAKLDVPVLIQGYPDDLDKLAVATRRDAYCGKISVCNNLKQYGIKYSLTKQHVVHPTSEAFEGELQKFVATCRVVKKLRFCRLGAIGARPQAFNTVRYSEKILERHGVTVTTVDWSEILGNVERLADDDPLIGVKTEKIKGYINTASVPEEKLHKQAKLAVIVEQWMEENAIDATAMQCWTSIQQNYGVNTCTLMAMMGSKLMPSACEVDVTGVLTMHAFAQASLVPSALVDWNNNYGDDPDKCVLFHCGNWPVEYLGEQPKMATAPILESVIGENTTYGAMDGRTPSGPVTYGRLTTDDNEGVIRGYLGESQLTDDPLDTFGTRAVMQVNDMDGLMQHVCREGFEHHAVINLSHTADVLQDALGNYLGWEMYRHDKPCCG